MNRTKTLYLLRTFLFVCGYLLISNISHSQSKLDSLLIKFNPERFADAIKKKADNLENKLVQKSIKVLEKMQKQEEKIYSRMLQGKDSLLAKTKLTELKEKYGALKSNLKNPALVKARQYIPRLDSFNTTLKFLDANGMSDKVKDALAKTEMLKSKFQQAEQIRKFIKERREQMKQQLEKLGMVKQLKQINKQVYYYSAQINEYKAILNDPKKIEKKALELLSKTKIWQDFFRKNSMLGRLFRLPDPDLPTDLSSYAGLQTRTQVNGLVQQVVQGAGQGGMEQFRQNMQGAQSQMNEIKTRINKLGGSGSDADMPEGFRPNNEKTKSFLKRLELGTNLQTQKSNSFFPTTTDLGLSLGYKLNSRAIVGIGTSAKIGLGRGWQHIRFSGEGIGLRSFVDMKLKGSIWITGGYEMNYKNAFNRLDVLKDFTAWQRSGLLGLSKSLPFKSKFFKNAKVQLLWDMLATENRPKTQPVIFRVGYSFK